MQIKRFIYNYGEIFSYSIGILAVVIGQIYLQITGLEIDNKLNVGMSMAALFSSMIASSQFKLRREVQRKREIEDRISKVANSISDGSGVFAVQYNDLMESYLPSKLRQANKVRNTFIPFRRGAATQEAENDAVIKLYKVFFESGGEVWHDIMGLTEFFGGRIRRVAASFSERAKSKKSFSPNHIISHSKHKIPMINFAILEYGNGEKELFFGWLYRGSSNQRHVFRTYEKNLIGLFESYFEFLEDYRHHSPTNISYQQVRTSDPAQEKGQFPNRAGKWLSISTENSSGSGTVSHVTSAGLVNIGFSEDGVKIQTDVFWKADAHPKLRMINEKSDHDAENAAYTKDKILVHFHLEPQGVRGLFYYKFRKDPDDGFESFSGTILTESGDLQARVFGIRAADSANMSDAIDNDTHRVQRLLAVAGLKPENIAEIKNVLGSGTSGS